VDISLVISAERGVLTKPAGHFSRLGWLEPDHHTCLMVYTTHKNGDFWRWFIIVLTTLL